jgi:hypothetical protein
VKEHLIAAAAAKEVLSRAADSNGSQTDSPLSGIAENIIPCSFPLP